jgi:hypothetical protein
MSNLQSLIYKLHMLAGALDVSVGDVSYTHDDHNFQTMPDEDTPEVAVRVTDTNFDKLCDSWKSFNY